MFGRRIVLAVFLGLVAMVVLGHFAPAGAAASSATADIHPRKRVAEVVAIHGAKLDIRTRQGVEAKAVTSSQTVFRIIGDADPSVGDLAVGDRIAIRGEVSGQDGGSPVVHASHIGLVPEGERMLGRVSAINDDGLEITRLVGPIIVNVASDTWVALGGRDLQWAGNPPGRDAISEGMLVVAFGEVLDETSFAAHTFVVRPFPHAPLRPIGGTIDSLDDASFSMNTAAGSTLRVQVNDQTRYRLPSVEDPGLDDLQVGAEVVVIGRPAGEETLQARLVAYRPERPATLAEIESINGNHLILVTRSGQEFRALAGPDTLFFISGNPEADLDDFAAGDTVLAVGERAGASDGFTLTHLAKRAAD
ncbi:MAG: DUF5666 domain-containing protein [Candidatus Promineifilaceae bacterium]|nr:DUF5666 domain-containing protein [Candidatus Promineifilaceae bacterium]